MPDTQRLSSSCKLVSPGLLTAPAVPVQADAATRVALLQETFLSLEGTRGRCSSGGLRPRHRTEGTLVQAAVSLRRLYSSSFYLNRTWKPGENQNHTRHSPGAAMQALPGGGSACLLTDVVCRCWSRIDTRSRLRRCWWCALLSQLSSPSCMGVARGVAPQNPDTS